MQYKKYTIGPYNLHIIKTDKFKTINIDITFRRPIVKEEITIRNFLSDLLLNSTAKYPSSRLLAIEAENLYGLKLSNQNMRIGNYAFTSFNLSILNSKYTEEGMLERSFNLLLDIIFNPNVEGNKFNSKAFKIVKNEIEAEIKSIKDNMTKYSLIRMLEEMDSSLPISYRGYGYLEDLEKITEENSYEYYQTMIKSDLVDIFVLGDIDISDIKKMVTKHIPINTIKRKKVPIVIEHKKIRKRIKKVVDHEDIYQSKLSIGCKLEKLTDFERKYVVGMYGVILGGPTSSKLFSVVREKHSLVYYINAQAKVTDNLLLIYAGIDKGKFDKTLRLVRLEMDKIKKGLITDEDLDKAKQMSVNAIKVAEDSPRSIIDAYIAKELLKSDDLEEKKRKLMLVTKEDIIKVSKKVKMDTVFLLEGVK
jgi:predicted Zn-dependent peptidase